MKRRNFIKSLIAGGTIVAFPATVMAYDNIQLNQRIVNIARSTIGRPGGNRYNTWIFGYNVMMAAGGRGPYYGPQQQYAWGRQISFSEVRAGDYIQIESPTAFRAYQRNGCGRIYWSCGGRCTWIVLNRMNGRRAGSVVDVAYMYKQNVVRYARIDTADLCLGNQIYFYRPQSR